MDGNKILNSFIAINETMQVSTRKGSEPVTIKNEDRQSSKRQREVSLEEIGPKSFSNKKKIRKSTSGSQVAAAQRENNSEVEAKYDACAIQNDSVLLCGLLADFDDLVATTSQEVPSCQGQSKAAKEPTVFDSDLDALFHDDFHTEDCMKQCANLHQFRTCRILEINRQRCHTRLRLIDIQDEAEASVECHGFWMAINVSENNLISICAKRNDTSDWIVDNDNGFIIVEPHLLVSATTVVSANFCHRKGILAENFRGLDSLPNVVADDFGMTVGTLVHEVLQTVLTRQLSSEAEIRKVIGSTLNSKRTMKMLYEANLPLAKCAEQLESYVPKIANFMGRYFPRNGRADGGRGEGGGSGEDKNFKGTIERVLEVEENIWLPELGLKGKIDVTVEARVGQARRVMPLEVKTGQPSFSAEHRGQLILYAMMLHNLGTEVDAGLLLYIRENIMEEVRGGHPARRDLIMLRNSLVNYLSKRPEHECLEGTGVKSWKLMELPEPINHRIACPKCPYATLCSVYAERDPSLHLSQSHVLREIAKESTGHLSPEHIAYVLKWITMLRLEESPRCDLGGLRDIWMLKPKAREKRGTCMSDLQIQGDVVIEGDWYWHTFVRKSRDEGAGPSDPSHCSIAEQEYVIVSTDTRINLSTGYVKNKSNDAIEILLDRNVLRQNPGATFHVDRYPSSRGLTAKNFANVACLLNDNEITNKLRSIVIDRMPASFVGKLPRSILEQGSTLLAELNNNQRRAVMTVISANDYVLIKGLPGTGKTRTLVALVEMLVRLGRSVLVTSHTHNAIDNLLLKLDERGVDFLRLGSEGRVNPALHHKSENVATADCTTPENLAALYSSKKVVAVTCMGATHSLVAKRIFDVCLVDESTQVLQPSLLRPIYSARKFVLVGDPQQLAPVVQNNAARKMGMDESLFARLDRDNNTVVLKLQYRMNRKIMSVANELTYGSSLVAGNREIADATLRMSDTMVLESCERWVRKALSQKIEDSVVLLNTGETYGLRVDYEMTLAVKLEGTSIQNFFEAAIIVRLVAVLREAGVVASSIGVICPYAAQVELLRGLLEEIEVNTVDQYQGRDKEVIFYSCTRSVPESFEFPGQSEILHDERRLTVAVTRAKHKLLVIGDKMSLRRYGPFEKLLGIVAADTIDLKPGHDNFDWENLGTLIRKKKNAAC